MIKNRRKGQVSIPQSITDAKAKQEEIALSGNKELIKGDIYKGKKRVGGKTVYEVREALKEIYHNKCAYCEIKEHKPEVEHFRPKKGITGEPGHPGYYWLCYEWSNLLPSCRYCNTEGGKGNKFPVMATHIKLPPITNGKLDWEKCAAKNPLLINEKPYLLNPETDDTDKFFEFESNGEMRGVDQEGRGEMTIEICDLNRENLLFRRQKIIDNLLTKIGDTFALYYYLDNSVDALIFGLKRIIEDLKSKSNGTEEFSLMKRLCFKNFDSMVLNLLEMESERDLLLETYNELNS